MTTFANALYRDVTCGLAATLITFVLGTSFVVSTAVPPGAHAPATHVTLTQHAWFGQPEPAVLVD
jgi:FlaG/FlaF family flagellin (archaellin)